MSGSWSGCHNGFWTALFAALPWLSALTSLSQKSSFGTSHADCMRSRYVVLCSLLTSSKDHCRLKSIRNDYCWECFPVKPKWQSLAESLLNKVQRAETLGLAGTKHGGISTRTREEGSFPLKSWFTQGSALKSQFESIKSIRGLNSDMYMRGSVVCLCVSLKTNRDANPEHRVWCMWVIFVDLEAGAEPRRDVCRVLHSALLCFMSAVHTAFPKRSQHNPIFLTPVTIANL